MAKIITLKDHKTNELAYPQTVSDAVYMDNGSTLEQYKESVSRQFANYPNVTVTGTVTNLPDNEDIRETEQHTLQLADRNNIEGMGYKILRKNKSFRQQVDASYEGTPNTIYEIRYDFDLADALINIPIGCILKFTGGSVSNGTLGGNYTTIQRTNGPIFNNIDFSGTWNVPEISSEMFLDVEEKNSLKRLFKLADSNIQNTIDIKAGSYVVSVSAEGGAALSVPSNTHLIVNGTISIEENSFERFYVLIVQDARNVTISGSGSIVGDKASHTGLTGEWGHGIYIVNSSDVRISGVKISYCWGDGICAGGGSTASNNVILKNLEIFQCRRQGITIGYVTNCDIDNCYIHHISGTAPQSGIDFEPNADLYSYNLSIRNCRFSDCSGSGIEAVNQGTGTTRTINNLSISNCLFQNSGLAAFVCRGLDNVTIENCQCESSFQITTSNAIINNVIFKRGNNTGECIRLGDNDNYDYTVLIQNCKFIGYQYGIYLKQNTVINNCYFDVLVPIDYSSLSKIQRIYIRNSVFRKAVAFRAYYGEFSNNSVFNGGGNVEYIFRSNGRYIQIENNEFTNNTAITVPNRGVYLDSSYTTLKNNTINLSADNADYDFDNLATIGIAASGADYSNIEQNIVLGKNVTKQYILSYKNIGMYRNTGPSSGRPTFSAEDQGGEVGFMYYDTDLGKPIFWNGSAWKDAAGNTIA